MNPRSHKATGAIDAPAWYAPNRAAPHADEAAEFARNLPLTVVDAALAIFSFAANQTVSGQVTFAHHLGEFAHAQAYELSTAVARAMPEGVLRDTILSMADLQAHFADRVIDAANRYGRSCAHLAFAFPSPSRAGH